MIKILNNKYDNHRGYRSNGDRKRAIKMLNKIGFNYFVCYKDTKSNFALTIGKADWVKPGQCYVNW